MNIDNFQYDLKSKDDFTEFLKMRKEHYMQKKNLWENDNLENYLEGLYGYSYDNNRELKNPEDWNVFAQFLIAAVVYE